MALQSQVYKCNHDAENGTISRKGKHGPEKATENNMETGREF